MYFYSIDFLKISPPNSVNSIFLNLLLLIFINIDGSISILSTRYAFSLLISPSLITYSVYLYKQNSLPSLNRFNSSSPYQLPPDKICCRVDNLFLLTFLNHHPILLSYKLEFFFLSPILALKFGFWVTLVFSVIKLQTLYPKPQLQSDCHRVHRFPGQTFAQNSNLASINSA